MLTRRDAFTSTRDSLTLKYVSRRELHFERETAKALADESMACADMKPSYDFSRAERGKHFAGEDAVFHVPVYLE